MAHSTDQGQATRLFAEGFDHIVGALPTTEACELRFHNWNLERKSILIQK
jgi:hypothetical protein